MSAASGPGTAASGGAPAPLARLFRYFSRYRGRAVAALLAMAVVSASTVALLFLLNKVIDDALGAGSAAALGGLPRPAAERAAPLLAWLERGYSGLLSAAGEAGLPKRFAVPLMLLAALLVKNVLSYFSEFELNGIGLGMVRDLRRDAYDRLIGQSSRFYSRSSTGDLMSRLLTDVEQIQLAFGSQLADFAQGALTIVLVLVYAFSLNGRLAFLVFVVAPVVLLSILQNARRLRKTAISSRQSGWVRWGRFSPRPSAGNRVIKTYGMEEFEKRRFRAGQRAGTSA